MGPKKARKLLVNFYKWNHVLNSHSQNSKQLIKILLEAHTRGCEQNIFACSVGALSLENLGSTYFLKMQMTHFRNSTKFRQDPLYKLQNIGSRYSARNTD